MFYDNLKQALEKQGKKVSPFLKELGYSTSNATKWKSGKLPDAEILIRICEKLNVSADALLDINIDVLKDNSGMTDEEKRIIYSYRKHPEMKTAVFKVLEIEEGEHKMSTTEIRFDNMRFYQRRWFKFTMKEHLIDLYHTNDVYEPLNNVLKVKTAFQWIRNPEDYSLDSKISAMLTLISKTNETFFDNKLFKIRNKTEADLLELGWNGSPFYIDRAAAFVKLHDVLDDGSNYSHFPLHDDAIVSETPPSTAKIAAQGDAEVQIAKNPKTSDNL